ncbi:putative protein LAZY1 [Helianthus annuus]|nr:putative protein LAZY1 [Helianthus annuus]KAJ0636302.1 putative protein LAZY1 [Helianthus annuus]KAJ0815621.1 putative protein LAZY1 [Helianthus annuus]
MQKRFWKNNEQSTNVSTGKSHYCFSALWEVDEQQHYPEANNNSAKFRQPVAVESHGVEIVKEEIVEMRPEFLHGLLAIGTLGSVMITNDPITPEPTIDAEETSAGEQILKKLENLTETELEKDTKENKNVVVYPPKVYYEMPAIKEDEKDPKAEKGVKTGTRVFHIIKKMLKKIDFESGCSTTSAFRRTAIIRDSTKKTLKKVFRKSRKIHPETADIHVNKSRKYDVKKMCYDESYDKEVTSDDDDDMFNQDGMFKKETICSNVQPAGRKAHWIKTDADCKYTCIIV